MVEPPGDDSFADLIRHRSQPKIEEAIELAKDYLEDPDQPVKLVISRWTSTRLTKSQTNSGGVRSCLSGTQPA